ncbi:MAG TPA: c-type cytochrome [Steroidobacteraceae bacterium]|nr:c-type cytochrome [Steroidobacteraceae bacterium]
MPRFLRRCTTGVLTVAALASFLTAEAAQPSTPGAVFRENAAWSVADGALATQAEAGKTPLVSRATLADSITAFDFRAPAGARATLYVQGRYAFELNGNGDWQRFELKFRAPRFDAGYNKVDNAFLLELRNGTDLRRNVIVAGPSEGAYWQGEDRRGPSFVFVRQAGPFALRNARHEPADFEQLKLPKVSGGDTNEKDLKDLVALGKEAFTQSGCEACHQVEFESTAVSSGPNLFGLFRADPRTREIVEGGEGHRFQIKAGREYLHSSVRLPADQLAVAEGGTTRGQPYLPVMPPYPKDALSDAQIDAIGDYLATLNEPSNRGPVVRLATLVPAAPYDPLADGMQWLVGDEVRLQRGPLPGTSGRAIHVGNPSGVNYTFDPRLLAIVKIWQGGFLEMSGEFVNRGNRGLALGYQSREIGFGDREYLLAPLNEAGQPVDFSFKEGKFQDFATFKASLHSKEDQLARIAATDAQFLGYSRNSKDKQASPVFKYRVGKNVVEVGTTISARGEVSITVNGILSSPQAFAVNAQLLKGATVSAGAIANDRWTLPAGKIDATLKGNVAVAAGAWRPAASNYSYQRAPLVRAASTAVLPAGYSIENYYPPKDSYGRDQLFEALGLAVTKDGTVVVATRSAGLWRIVRGEWRLFAEGVFDSLGVIAEDAKGLVVVAGQKAELTRISDTNGDGIADQYETLFDAHSFHANYHSYMHGPVRGVDGAYYFTLNLVHAGDGSAHMGGGSVMGTWGGFNGWAVRVEPSGKFQLFANGLRSPASVGASPDGRVWYADNQGDFVATSKLFQIRKDKFYGHPAGLVDLPGMTPDSPEIKWDQVSPRRERAVILFPHNRVANSPGNPTWVTHKKFGPFAGQMLIGDQTQSNLLRVAMQKVGGVEQGSVMPFFEGLESGVMRPVFLPDGSLLLGQTGRGWQAKGGKLAALQRVTWDGKTVAPQIVAMLATPEGFRVDLTQPLGKGVSEAILRSALSMESWTYRDAPDYGSPELDLHGEDATAITVSADRKTIYVKLVSTEQKTVHPQQTARVYRVKLASATLFDGNAPAELNAYYTLYEFPVNAK